MISLCGIPIEPRGAWTDDERAVFELFEGPPSGEGFTIATSAAAVADVPLSGYATTLRWNGLELSMRNPNLTARIDFVSRSCVLQRTDNDSSSLKILLRTLLTCELPRRGMLPLHAGAAIIDGEAVVFMGRSGAGKSTLAASCPYPLLTDELIAIDPAHRTAKETGFWGDAIIRPVAHPGNYPIRALLSLEKSKTTTVAPLPPADAARAIIASTLVPAGPLWPEVLPSIERASRALSHHHLAFTIDGPVWQLIASISSSAALVSGRNTSRR